MKKGILLLGLIATIILTGCSDIERINKNEQKIKEERIEKEREETEKKNTDLLKHIWSVKLELGNAKDAISLYTAYCKWDAAYPYRGYGKGDGTMRPFEVFGKEYATLPTFIIPFPEDGDINHWNVEISDKTAEVTQQRKDYGLDEDSPKGFTVDVQNIDSYNALTSHNNHYKVQQGDLVVLELEKDERYLLKGSSKKSYVPLKFKILMIYYGSESRFGTPEIGEVQIFGD